MLYRHALKRPRKTTLIFRENTINAGKKHYRFLSNRYFECIYLDFFVWRGLDSSVFNGASAKRWGGRPTGWINSISQDQHPILPVCLLISLIAAYRWTMADLPTAAHAPCMVLPVDIWLLVFDVVNDLDLLWSTVRNVSRHLREVVDEFFCYGQIQSILIELYYSTINRQGKLPFTYVRLPFRFDSLSEDRSKAIFRQVAYKEQSRSSANGSVHGWVPFFERYCEETLQTKPKIMNPGKHSLQVPAWEKDYATLRSTLARPDLKSYFVKLRDHISIGRGDRPPYILRLHDYLHDTELVDCMVNCSTRELSFDWRRTLSALFMEQHFLAHSAHNIAPYKPMYDESLKLVALRMGSQGYIQHSTRDERRVRRKRLRPWVARNRSRMTDEHRLLTEDRAELETEIVKEYLHKENLRDLKSEDIEEDELVPENLAKDYPGLLLWPWIKDESLSPPSSRRLKCCTVL